MNFSQIQEMAISIHGIRKVFSAKEREIVALDGIDLDITPGEFVCVLGPSGCGKSTLLNAVAGFSSPTSGKVIANGWPVKGPGPDRAMVFQEYALFPWMTVERNVAFGLFIKGVPKEEISSIVDPLLNMLHLYEFRDRYPKDLSGGMKQRVAIARTLAIDSPILLMDEPFGALDALTRRNLQDELLRIWSEHRRTIMFVTHNIEESIFLADRVMVMTYRPGTIKKIIPITLPRPRDPASPEFNELERMISTLVMEEQARHEEDEAHTVPADELS
jgi:NitT/TauT family transport system ATP-binding protein